ncbi:PREDICTED: uncharacterized protein LOC108561045 isoform X1 [Nicrophorus vespilloides]|uniref:Biogenesis of lysosome-related organelles complex 1 subunit 3 n=1 Tax=Nicrophorus vespilloides TaxID=110193 RepID=A0ABM1MIE3_NICVS|nr:PREDICTED: uncharacterized protein LOC108561045 isoform X1 [Nicrophorus vespilloides]
MESKLVVRGEASETESEDEPINITESLSVQATMANSRKGEVITGEDSESDSETVIYTNEPTENQLPRAAEKSMNKPKKTYETLLIRKLKDDNKQLYRDLDGFTTETITKARDVLNTAEQELIKSQITLQGALTALRGLNHNSAAIKNKLRDILSSNFISNINKNIV